MFQFGLRQQCDFCFALEHYCCSDAGENLQGATRLGEWEWPTASALLLVFIIADLSWSYI
jgi:hypothetical protein